LISGSQVDGGNLMTGESGECLTYRKTFFSFSHSIKQELEKPDSFTGTIRPFLITRIISRQPIWQAGFWDCIPLKISGLFSRSLSSQNLDR
jgi:hypothetical protein